jgi:hypothetical protein
VHVAPKARRGGRAQHLHVLKPAWNHTFFVGTNRMNARKTLTNLSMLPEEPEGWSSLAVPWGQHEDYFLAAVHWPDSP